MKRCVSLEETQTKSKRFQMMTEEMMMFFFCVSEG